MSLATAKRLFSFAPMPYRSEVEATKTKTELLEAELHLTRTNLREAREEITRLTRQVNDGALHQRPRSEALRKSRSELNATQRKLDAVRRELKRREIELKKLRSALNIRHLFEKIPWSIETFFKILGIVMAACIWAVMHRHCAID